MISPFLGSKTVSPLVQPSGWARRKSGTTGRFGTLTIEAETLAPLGLRLNGRPLQFPRAAMEAAKPGSKSRSTDVFSGGFKAGAHRAAR